MREKATQCACVKRARRDLVIPSLGHLEIEQSERFEIGLSERRKAEWPKAE